MERNVNKKYPVIIADPPWSHRVYSHKGKGRSPEAYYDTMSDDDIMSLPVADWAEPNSILFIWGQSEKLDVTLDVIKAWGFKFKTKAFTWVKISKRRAGNIPAMGLGHWTRKATEDCWLATRGSPKRVDAGVCDVIHAIRGQHSEKPELSREKIERLVAGPYLELFSRSSRPGWTAWGNQTGILDAGGKVVRRWSSTSHPPNPHKQVSQTRNSP